MDLWLLLLFAIMGRYCLMALVMLKVERDTAWRGRLDERRGGNLADGFVVSEKKTADVVDMLTTDITS